MTLVGCDLHSRQQQVAVLVTDTGAKIRAMVVRKTKTDRRDAQHLLDLLKHERSHRVDARSDHP